MDLQHPTIDRIERTGYPLFNAKREEYGIDGLGNEVLCGDEILVYEDVYFSAREIGAEAKEVLESLGACYQIAK